MELSELDALKFGVTQHKNCIESKHENPEWVDEIEKIYHDCLVCSGLTNIEFPVNLSVIRKDSSKSRNDVEYSDLRSLYKSIVGKFLSSGDRNDRVIAYFPKINKVIEFDMFNDANPQVLLISHDMP